MPEPTPFYNDAGEAYDLIARDYDATYQDAMARQEDLFVQKSLLALGALLPGVTQVLDLGCGTGWLLDHFPLIPPEDYLGVDLSRGMIAEATRKHPGYAFLRGDITRFRATAHAFDLAVSIFGSLSYCGEGDGLRRVAEGIQEALRPAGRFYLMAYSPDHVGARVFKRQGLPEPSARPYTPEDLAAALMGLHVTVMGSRQGFTYVAGHS